MISRLTKSLPVRLMLVPMQHQVTWYTHVELLDVGALGVLGLDDARADDLDRPEARPVPPRHLRV
jgi:hypothetical protein